MILRDIIDKLGLELKNTAGDLNLKVTGGYTSDLLSDVIANAKQGDLWVTLHTHLNIIAVAGMKELAGIIIVNNRDIEEETIEKANTEGIPLLVSRESAFTLSGRLYALGIGKHE